MDHIRAALKMRRPRDRKPDFERFARAITSREPGPVPIGDLFADFETVGNYLGQWVFDQATTLFWTTATSCATCKQMPSTC